VILAVNIERDREKQALSAGRYAHGLGTDPRILSLYRIFAMKKSTSLDGFLSRTPPIEAQTS
jgi:hypothetical protein